MPGDLLKLQDTLRDSINLIEDRLGPAHSISPDQHLTDEASQGWRDPDSLLSRCNAVCDDFEREIKPTLRIIHHPACSGGTLIAKCISAIQNVFLLSEVHPFSDLHHGVEKPMYRSSDIAALANYAGIPGQRELANAIFLDSIALAHKHVRKLGGELVLRDHSHYDFFTGPLVLEHPGVRGALEHDFNLVSLVTIRDPVECFLSLANNNWLHFEPPTFEEYCRRFNAFLDYYSELEVVRYEDFVVDPDETMKQICDLLELPFNPYFKDIMDIFRVTGDSGRVSNETIAERARKKIPADLQTEIRASESYHQIADSYGYTMPPDSEDEINPGEK